MELAFQAMATLPTLELAAENLKREHGITTTPWVLKAIRGKYPDRFQRAYDESASLREAYLVDGMIENANLATLGEAKAAERTIQALDAGEVTEPWRVGRDLADMKAKNVDKSRLMQERPTVITERLGSNERWRLLQRAIDAESAETVGAEVVEDEQAPQELPPAAAERS
jgi:hypothetical protein